MSPSTPHRDGSHDSVEHRARRLRSRAAPPKLETPKPSIRWQVVLLVVSVVLMAWIWRFVEVATLDYPEARDLADRLHATVESVWAGDLSLDDPARLPEGLRAYEFEVDGRPVWVLTHAEPTAFSTCYGLRTGGGLGTVAIRFEPTDEGCVPSGPWAVDASGAWSEVLPRRRVTPVWFVPVVGLGVGCALWCASSIVMRRFIRS